jgi:hypothetical protein
MASPAARPTGEHHPPAPLHPDLVDYSIVAIWAPEIGAHRSATLAGFARGNGSGQAAHAI